LSAAFDVNLAPAGIPQTVPSCRFGTDRNKPKAKVEGGGQEYPPYTVGKTSSPVQEKVDIVA
jgi:hypothetical protein